jgi:serine/threonine protein phosphatase PrpC
MNFEISASTAQGEREYQQDRLIIEQGRAGFLLAVMDGHGRSDRAAELVAEKLPAIWFQEAKGNSWQQRIFTSFEKLGQLTANEDSGTTVSMVWIPRRAKHAHIGILGDSPVALRHGDGTFWVGPEHNAINNEAERRAAVERGASFKHPYLHYRGVGFQFSRSLGDASLGAILNRTPEVFTVPLDPGSTILIATDGVFSSQHDTNIEDGCRDLFKILDAGGDTDAIVADAINRQTKDNVTVIVCKIT